MAKLSREFFVLLNARNSECFRPRQLLVLEHLELAVAFRVHEVQ